jgi:membrane-bound lytic murein transglycosylase B
MNRLPSSVLRPAAPRRGTCPRLASLPAWLVTLALGLAPTAPALATDAKPGAVAEPRQPAKTGAAAKPSTAATSGSGAKAGSPAKAGSAAKSGSASRPGSASKADAGTKADAAAKSGAASKSAAAAKPATVAARPAPQADPAPPLPDYAGREEVREFARSMAERHGFDEAALLGVLGQARGSRAAIRLMAPAPPGFKRSWVAYRGRFVEPTRIREGLRFWRENADALGRAAERWGVPAEVIVAIIGVETIYGRNTGDFRVIDALSTLAFDYPRRAAYFREELEQYLLLAREGGFDPLAWRGSFAGAVGLPQFMPGSIRRHAVDFDGDGRIDLRGSAVDAVGSVASFLANHGWQAGGPTHFPVEVADEARAQAAIDGGSPPRMTMTELGALGLTSPREVPADLRLTLIDLPNGDGTTTYVLGANNFWVVTRYNRSFFYAMAVIDLAQALKDARSAPVARD